MRQILQANVPRHRSQSFTSHSDPTVNPDFWGPAPRDGDHVGDPHDVTIIDHDRFAPVGGAPTDQMDATISPVAPEPALLPCTRPACPDSIRRSYPPARSRVSPVRHARGLGAPDEGRPKSARDAVRIPCPTPRRTRRLALRPTIVMPTAAIAAAQRRTKNARTGIGVPAVHRPPPPPPPRARAPPHACPLVFRAPGPSPPGGGGGAEKPGVGVLFPPLGRGD